MNTVAIDLGKKIEKERNEQTHVSFWVIPEGLKNSLKNQLHTVKNH